MLHASTTTFLSAALVAGLALCPGPGAAQSRVGLGNTAPAALLHNISTLNADLNGGTQTLTSAGSTDGFYVKYDSTGALLWKQRIGNTGDDQVWAITTDGRCAVF